MAFMVLSVSALLLLLQLGVIQIIYKNLDGGRRVGLSIMWHVWSPVMEHHKGEGFTFEKKKIALHNI